MDVNVEDFIFGGEDAIRKIANVLETYGFISLSRAMQICDVDMFYESHQGFVLDPDVDSMTEATRVYAYILYNT